MPETFNFSVTQENLAYNLIFSPEVLDEVPVSPDWFFENKPRKVVEAVLKLRDDRATIDLTTVVAELERSGTLSLLGGMSYFAGLATVSMYPSDIPRLLHELEDAYRRIQIRQIAGRLAGGSHSPEHDTNELIDSAIRDLNETSFTAVSPMHTAYDGAMSVLTKAQAYELDPLEAGQVRGFNTGYLDINEALGGFVKGTVTYYLADEHVGKTWMMINLLAKHHALVPDARSRFFTLEMSGATDDDPVKSTLWDRLICMEAGISTTKYKSGTLSQQQWASLNDAVARVSQWDLSIVDSTRDMYEIERICRNENRLRPVTMVVVDYLKLITGCKGRNRNEEIGEMTRRFQWLSKQIDASFHIPQQVGGKKLVMRKNKRPNLSDGYESGHISQDADGVVALYRDEVYNSNTQEPNIMEYNILKDRVNQGTGSRVYLYFNKNTGLIGDVHRGYEPPSQEESDEQTGINWVAYTD